MFLNRDHLTVTLKGITFRSSRTPGLAADWTLDSSALIGWTDGVGARRQVTQRPTSSGDFADNATMASRLVSITGMANAKNHLTLHAMRDQFVGLLADGGYTQITVEDGSGARYATVGQENTPNWIQHTDTIATYKMDLFQPDPRIYGVQRTISVFGAPTASGGLIYSSTGPASANPPYYLNYPLDYSTPVNQQSQTLTNAGNTDAWPVFTVAGNFYGGFTITDNLGNNITYTGDTSLFAPVTIDSKTGSASQNGQDRSTLLSQRGWFSISPGETIQPSFNPVNGAGGWCDIIYRDTWI